MRFTLFFLALLASLASASVCSRAAPATGEARAVEADIQAKVSVLLRRMTLEEKIGQLNFPSLDFPFDRQLERVRSGRIGGLLNIVDPKFLTAFKEAVAASRLKIPLLFAIDAIYAFRITFPTPIAWAATWRPELAELAAETVARETAQSGVNLTFAPMVDISRDPRWGRVMEGAGEDAFLGSAFAAARVRGYRKGGLATAAKHFVGYGAPEGGRDYNGAQISTSELFDRYLPPFQAAIEAGSETVMASFNTVNGVPVTANRPLLTGVLKDRLGFKGLVMSDFAAVGELVNHGIAADQAEAARKALHAGVDFEMAGHAYDDHLLAGVRAGKVSMTDIDAAVRRVLAVKYRMGLFTDSPVPRSVPVAPDEASVRAAARKVARESFVLLKNNGATLPITPAMRTVALIGAAALSTNDHSWYGPAGLEKPATETLRDALEKRMAAGQRLIFAKGFTDACGTQFENKPEAIAAARSADLIVLVISEDCNASGEAASRAHLGLSGVHQEMLETLATAGKPIALVIETGRPLTLAKASEQAAAMLIAWHPGTEGRTALAEVLAGEISPSGKLPMTFPRAEGQIPITYDALPTSRPATGDRYTTGYIDEKFTPLYPFGHGLSYTTFRYTDLKVGAPSMTRRGSIDIDVAVENTGAVAGSEVAQLYIHQLVAARSRPLRQLKGFQKIDLAPGEKRTVHFRLPASALAYHDDDGNPVIEPGPFRVFVGGSSVGGLEGGFAITAE
jgi:beta-glucosidase